MKKALDLNREILNKLYWQDNLSLPKIARRYELDVSSVLKRMKKYNIARRNFSESSYVASDFKPKFNIKAVLNFEEEKLKIAGIMLYWAEGCKKVSGVDFVNSDPLMIKMFLEFLRRICGIDESRLRVYLYTHENSNIDNLKLFWSNVTDISLKQFIKPYIRRSNLNLSNRKMPHGLIHIRYYDKRLLETILNWVEEYISSLQNKIHGQVPKRSNGTDCVKTQRLAERQTVKAGEFRGALISG
ncbi:MAG: hypothetical protein AUJ89_06360 [Candidatus Omnitrophica bacterium CG1_02_43_210]|nr:MAG: hypothetical protein AUJ89_06360 [Candidatus Omnitrophica bacterium CG1_02_43_210]PIV12283.1 MAG: hypothetical protein COS48_01615 [Candidatus Omnitrophica bacterium CG03_land_8_20_14_0_80_43_22]